MATGRRARVREKIKSAGFDALAPHESLEAMLYMFVPRKDTGAIARALIERFGSLDGVIFAKEEDIASVKGVPKQAAFHLANMRAFYEKALFERAQRTPVSTPYALENYLKNVIGFNDKETVVILFLDSRMRIKRRKILHSTEHNRAKINLRDLSNDALLAEASYVMIAHNHPCGTLKPSAEDIEFTKEAGEFLAKLGIKLVEHVIVSENETFSMRDEGYLK
jgi:DNA repair protein RadC